MKAHEEKCEENFIFSLAKQSFHRISLTLLSLLLPLSFLLLPKLTFSSKILSIILYILILPLSFTCLIFPLTGHSLNIKAPKSIAWIILILFQGSISMAIKDTTTMNFELIGDYDNRIVIWFRRSLIVLGIYETMMLWRRMIVKTVVDDTIYGEESKERGVEKIAMGVAFVVLWLWMLKMGMEPLVFDIGKERMGKGDEWNVFALHLVGFSVLMKGSLRIMEVLLWPIMAAVVKIMKWREQKNQICIEAKV